jgi:hypothetical protein
MTRKTLDVTIKEDGRDKGKVYRITEASAWRADRWGIRAMLAMNKRGAAIPDEILKMGIIGIMAVGVHKFSGVDWSDLEPLLDEMMGCVVLVPTPAEPRVTRAINFDSDDIEEVQTYSILRKEIFALHVGFTEPVAP